MATYSITESRASSWSEEFKYKFRRSSSDGHPVAEDEMERRRSSGRPGFLWRWEDFRPTFVYAVNDPG